MRDGPSTDGTNAGVVADTAVVVATADRVAIALTADVTAAGRSPTAVAARCCSARRTRSFLISMRVIRVFEFPVGRMVLPERRLVMQRCDPAARRVEI